MVSPYVKKLARETGKSEKEITQFWDKAKKIAQETFGVTENDFTTEHFEFAIETVKNMLGLSEEIVNPANFLQSELSAKEYIETVVSGSFSVGDKNPVIPPKGPKVKIDDEEEEDEKSTTT